MKAAKGHTVVEEEASSSQSHAIMKKRSNDSCSPSSPEESPLSNHSDESTVEHDSKAAATKSENSKNNNENQSPSPSSRQERFTKSPSPETDTTVDSSSSIESSDIESETSEMIETAQQLDFDCEAVDFSFRPRKFSKKWRCKTIKATGPMKLSRRLS